MAPGVPTVVGRHVQLAPVGPEHAEFLHALLTDQQVGFRFVLAGAVPGPDQYREALLDEVFVQFLIVSRLSGRPLGLARALRARFDAGHAYVSVASTPRLVGTGLALEGLGLLTDYMFERFGFAKLYAESVAFNAQQFASAREYFNIEARLRDHHFYAGRHWDVYVLSITRAQWMELRPQFIEDLVADSPPRRGTRRPRRLAQ
jgi:hypothetical protein